MSRGRPKGPVVWGLLLLLAFGAGAGLRAALPARGPAGGAWAAVEVPQEASGPGWLSELGRQVVWGPGAGLLLGFTVLGAPLVAAAVWVRGYMLGLAIGAAALSWGLPGLPALLLGVLPSQLLGAASALVAACEALRFSVAVLGAAVGNQVHELPRAFARYVSAAAAALALAVGAATMGVYGQEAAQALMRWAGLR